MYLFKVNNSSVFKFLHRVVQPPPLYDSRIFSPLQKANTTSHSSLLTLFCVNMFLLFLGIYQGGAALAPGSHSESGSKRILGAKLAEKRSIRGPELQLSLEIQAAVASETVFGAGCFLGLLKMAVSPGNMWAP